MVRDFPIQISSFLHTAPVDPVQLGSILGQEYSLSQILLVLCELAFKSSFSFEILPTTI